MSKAAASYKGTHLLHSVDTHDLTEKVIAKGKTIFIERLALTLLREVQSLGEVPMLDIEEGIDLYQEVLDFEKGIIERVLLHTGCHQVRAANLLKLKPTTLNSKIKHYRIDLDDLITKYNAIFKDKGLKRP